MKTLTFAAALLVSALIAPASAQQQSEPLEILKTRPDAAGEALLGGTFQNPLAGIAFRVPAPCKPMQKGGGDEIARFASDDKAWELVVTKATSAQPLPLTGEGDANNKLGLLEVTAARLKQSNPGIEIVRQDTVTLGETNAGIIAGRMMVGSQRKLLQQAIVQPNEQLYYTFSLSTPAAKDAKGVDSDDPAEKVAAESFRQMLDTIKMLDRTPIKADQDERLYRTRALFVELNGARMKKVLIPEQWLRLQHDGRDIGYTYIVEEADAKPGSDAIKIGIRSRSYPDAETQVDGETWYNVTGDRKHETWSNVVWVQNHKTKQSDQFNEFGSSDMRVTRTLDTSGAFAPGEGADAKQPPIKTGEVYTLRVQTIGKTKTAEPITQNLSPWYIPQAVGHLLPRVLPIAQPKAYLFATYVSEQRAVMHRYVDVGTEQEVDLGGARVRAVPITDRLGLEGSATTHYVSPEGKYLGSVNKDSRITILPSDATTLQKLWENKANLSRPVERQQPPAQQSPQAKQ